MYRTKTSTRSVVALALAAPALSFAAAPSDENIIEQIIVTAQKRATALQDVPFSVAAPTGDQIRNAGASSLPELGRMVPGLAIADLGPGQSQVALRGISAGQVVRDQPGVKAQVGIYLDESPISVALFTPDLDLYDLQRFEVLRGPQGTLFGSGSISGVLRYITAQPELGLFGGTVEATASTGTDSEFGGALKGMVNVPVGDISALRLVAYHNELPGFIDSVYPGRGKREDVNSGTKSGARLSWLIQPTENLSITPRIVYQKLETDGYPRIDVWNILGNPFTTTEPPVTPGERGQVTQLDEGLTDEFRLFDVKVEANVGPVTLSSITSRTNRDVLVLRDASQLTGSVTVDLGFPEEARIDSPLFDRTQLEAFSQEFRVSSNDTGSFQWLIGTFFEDVDRKYGQTLPTAGYDALTGVDSTTLNAPPDTPFYSRLTYNLQQFAIFGEATWHFADQWAATLGARYYDYDENRVLTFGGLFSAATGDAQAVKDAPASVSSDGFSPRFILSYDVTDDVTINAQIARGFRLGGINDPLNEPLCGADLALFSSIFSPTWDDELAWNYEVGAKTQWMGGRVTFNSAVFYSDIDDLQANVDAGNCSSRIVVNVPKAHTFGVEAELFARPTSNWDFGIGATWVEAEIDSTVTGIGTTPLAGIREGNRLPTAPELQASASIGYNQPVFSSLEGFGVLTLQYVGSSFSQLADQEPGFGCVGCAGSPRIITIGDPTITSIRYDNEMPSYQIGNLRVGVRSDVWEAALFINNLWDERAFLALDRERGTSARVGYITNQPRTVGVSLRMSF